MNSLTVFYDDGCALCLRCRDWLLNEPQIVPLVLIQKGLLAARHPQLAAVSDGSDLVAISDTGDYWIGDAAFLTILFSLERYRAWAERLATPALRPYAKKFFETLSENRGRLSWILGGTTDDTKLAGALDALPSSPACSTEACTKEGAR